MTLPSHKSDHDHPKRRIILLVEDEPFVRQATCSILESAGFEVLPTEDADAAMKVYKEFLRKIDLVMTDLVLPGRSGEQLGQDLREHSSEIRVLVTSGYGNPEGNPEYDKYEKEDRDTRTFFLAKPYSRRTLVDKIERILEATPLARPATQAG